MNTGEMIKHLRKKKGITQKQLSQLTGIPLRTLQDYEAGKCKPKFDRLIKITEELITDSDDPIKIIVETIDDTSSYTEDVKKIMSDMITEAKKIMPPETKKKIESISYIKSSGIKLFGVDEFDLEKGDIVIKAGSYSLDEITELCNYMLYLKSKRTNNSPE